MIELLHDLYFPGLPFTIAVKIFTGDMLDRYEPLSVCIVALIYLSEATRTEHDESVDEILLIELHVAFVYQGCLIYFCHHNN